MTIPGNLLTTAMAGYSDLKAKYDLDLFFSLVDRPRGIHLCGNPDWDFLSKKGVDKEHLLSKSLLSPATCCLINPDKEKTVERAFTAVTQISRQLRKAYYLT